MQQSNAALQRRNEALKDDTTTSLPQPKKDSASVDIMEKRSVQDGPFRPPRSFEDPEYGKIEIHFGCLPGGDVELPSDEEQDEDTREQALRRGFPPSAAPPTAAARSSAAPPVSSTIPSNQAETKSAAAAPNTFGLQMQATVTHFRMNSGIANVAKTTTPPVQPPPTTLRSRLCRMVFS